MEPGAFQDHMLTLGRPLAISRIEDHFMWSSTYLDALVIKKYVSTGRTE